MTSSSISRQALLAVAGLLALLAAGGPAPRARAANPEAEDLQPVAVLPLENLTGHPQDLDPIRDDLRAALERRGIALLDERTLEAFLAKHRIRWTGGLSVEESEALERETGARAVLATSLDTVDNAPPPRVAMTSRLVRSGAYPRIVWMDGAASAGDDAPGFLSLGIVTDPAVLRARTIESLAASLARRLEESGARADGRASERTGLPSPGGRFRPRRFYRSSTLALGGEPPIRIAVLPFLDESGRRRAGDVVSMLFVRDLSTLPGVEVLDPGSVRDTLLRARLIMEGGVSVPQVEALHSLLQADLVVSGTVTEFREFAGPTGSPLVEFSVRIIEGRTSQAVWSSISYNQGNDGVFFFGCGRVRSASAMASEMARQVVARLARGDRTRRVP